MKKKPAPDENIRYNMWRGCKHHHHHHPNTFIGWKVIGSQSCNKYTQKKVTWWAHDLRWLLKCHWSVSEEMVFPAVYDGALPPSCEVERAGSSINCQGIVIITQHLRSCAHHMTYLCVFVVFPVTLQCVFNIFPSCYPHGSLLIGVMSSHCALSWNCLDVLGYLLSNNKPGWKLINRQVCAAFGWRLALNWSSNEDSAGRINSPLMALTSKWALYHILKNIAHKEEE